jgi:hypothetical protein
MAKNKQMFSNSLTLKIKRREHVTVNINDLKSNVMNPPERTETNKQFMVLKKGIRELGVLSSVHFCGDSMTLINGHRRVKSAKENGIETIAGYSYNGLTSVERDILFEHLNSTSCNYSGKQKLFTYLEGGKVNDEFLDVCHQLEAIGKKSKFKNGREALVWIRNQGLSPNTYLIAIDEYCKVVQDKSINTKVKVFDWLVDVGRPNRLKDLIRLKCPSHLLERAVNNKRPISGTWSITAV